MDQDEASAHAAFERRKSRIGMRMTLLYSVVYVGFVALSVFTPACMGARAILGLNLAVAYGLGLIVVAVVLALVYNQLCRNRTTGTAANSANGADTAASGEER